MIDPHSTRTPFAYLQRIFIGLSAAGVAGCASTLGSSQSTAPEFQQQGKISGIPYGLPRVMLSAVLVRDEHGVSVEISQPVYSADPKATYLLKYVRRGSSKDTFDIGVDPLTSLLRSAGGEAEDQTAQAIVAVAKAVSGLAKPEAAVAAPSRRIFYQGIFDPAIKNDRERVEKAIQNALSGDARASIRHDCESLKKAAAASTRNSATKDRSGKGAPPSVPEEIPACTLTSSWPQHSDLSFDVNYSPFKFQNVSSEDCSVGICTRVVLPAVISVMKKGCELGSQVFSMPNDSAAVPIDLRRANFAKSTHGVTLTNGLVSTTKTTKDSEVLAVASIPFDILKAVFAAPAELIQLKVNLTNTDKALLVAQKEKLEAEKARLEAEKQLEEAREATDGGAAPSGGSAGKQESNPTAPAAASTAGSETSRGPLMKVMIPGLGRGSGAELIPGLGLPSGSEAISQGPPPRPDTAEKGSQSTSGTTPDFGGRTASGSDGPKK